jgi:decaprenylphospho-beta-D-erythro-pentofuranosid-2-ulose 2-reductase
VNENVLIVGATSGIARALGHELAEQGCHLMLAGRRQDELDRCAADLRTRYQTPTGTEPFEALDFESHPAFFTRCLDHFAGTLHGLILCHGYMPNQTATQTNITEVRRTIDVNFTSAISLLMLAANYFEQRKSGYIVVLSSVAGDRGRMSNYTYGAAKAGLNAYLQGMRNRLQHAGVQVLTVKPGFVDTPMTHGLLNPHSPLVATPERVAREVNNAIRKRKDVIYSPGFWRVLMAIIRALPESIFKRLRF